MTKWMLLLVTGMLVGCGPANQTPRLSKAIRSGDNDALVRAFRADPKGLADDDGKINLVEVAAEVGNREAMSVLLQHGANAYGSGRNWWKSPLRVAVRAGDVELVRLLLRYGADPNWSRALNDLDEKNNGEEIAKLLIASGADVNGVGEFNQTILESATQRKTLWNLKTLLAAGADPNRTPNGNVSALHWAAYKLDIGMARLLIQHGADKRKRDHTGRTPMEHVGDLVGLMERYGGKHGG